MGLVELGLLRTCDGPCSFLCCPVHCLARCTQILLRRLLSFITAAHALVFGEVTVCLFSFLRTSWYLLKAYIQGHSCCLCFCQTELSTDSCSSLGLSFVSFSEL